MEIHRSLIILCLGALMAASTACQRGSTGVEAAREERALNPNNKNPSNARTRTQGDVLSAEDQDVAFKLEQANMEEIDLARYVANKTRNATIKNFAKMLIDDHDHALNEIQDLLRDKNVNQMAISKSENEISNMNTLEKISGPSLDRQFLGMVVREHEKDLDWLRHDEAVVQSQDLKNYIRNLIPIVQSHLDKADDLENKSNKSRSDDK